MYPVWIRLVYKKIGGQVGYTGSVTSKIELLALITRLGIQINEITSLEIDDKMQSFHEIEKVFENIETRGNDGANRRTEKGLF